MEPADEETPVTVCPPSRRTPKDRIRIRERAPVAGTIVRANKARRPREESPDEAMRVALNQPHRLGAPALDSVLQTDANYLTSELGKFCRARHDGGDGKPMAYRTSTAFLRYRAGMQFAMIVNDDQIAHGLPGLQRGDAEWAGVPSDQTLEARKELCQMRRKAAEAVLGAGDKRGSLPMGVWAMTTLCFDDRALPEHLHELGVELLYRLSLHFGIEKPAFHEAKT